MAAASQKVTFTGSLGEMLAARLDLPEGKPRAYALFAHCFSCSKDVLAAKRIAEGLSEKGFAVLRFDFTGLGASEGEFANTNFSSNVADLLKAADYLREQHEAPRLLIGHSLGGAAVLMAAGQVPECEAVATLAAPADTEHVKHTFSQALDTIERDGEAEVRLAGRPFRIKKQFVEDLAAHKVEEAVAALKKPLAVFHAPLDDVVGIENATRIFVAAKHPKSFISLDNADHLLSRREDAAYAAAMIAAWAGRFVGTAPQPAERPLAETAQSHVVVQEAGEGKYDALAAARGHLLHGDQPRDLSGLDRGPNPYEFLAVSLGLCTTQTLRMYAEHKKWPLERATVHLKFEKVHAEDCEDCAKGKDSKVLTFWRELELAGDLTDEQRQRLLEIADKCPVHKSLQEKTPIHTSIKIG